MAAEKEIAVIVAGTGFEGRPAVIKRWASEGAPVQLRREPHNDHDPNAIAVWLRARVFVVIPMWRKIGYVKADRAASMAPKIDAGQLEIRSAYVRSFFAPDGREFPRVSLVLRCVDDSPAAPRARKPPCTAV